jgi:hypothetical protein
MHDGLLFRAGEDGRRRSNVQLRANLGLRHAVDKASRGVDADGKLPVCSVRMDRPDRDTFACLRLPPMR